MTRTTGARIPELDGLRGVAILLVLVWHLLPGILRDAPDRVNHLATSLIRFAWSGVDLFFVLSGFLIGGILIDNRASNSYFRTFYVRRFYRILPLYYVAVALFVVLLRAERPDRLAWLFDRPMPTWSYLTFTQNVAMARAREFGAQWLGVTWSLAIEEQFYLILPVLIWLVPRAALWVVIPLLALASPLMRIASVQSSPESYGWTYMLLPARADALLLGVVAALVFRSARMRSRVVEFRVAMHVGLAVLALGIAGMALQHQTVSSPWMVAYGYSIFALFYAVILLLAVTAREDEAIGRLLRLPWLRRTGMLAYGLYVMHMPILGLSALVARSPAIVGLIAAAATFTCARLSWEHFEKPLVERGHRWQYQP